jgi:CHASE3 domain sensor protein
MVNFKTSRLLIVITGLGLLAAADYVAANSLGLCKDAIEMQQIRKQDAEQVSRHLQLSSLVDEISKLNYDAGVAMGGYSITKDAIFSTRFEKIEAELPKRVAELKHLVSKMPQEEEAAESIDKLSTRILDVNRKAKAQIDDPHLDVANFKARPLYKTLRDNSDKLQNQIQSIRQKDLAIVNKAIFTTPDTQNTGLSIFILAFSNAIFGLFLLWLLGNGQQESGR